MTNNLTRPRNLIATLALCIASTACAAQDNSREGPPNGPPPEAIEACENLSVDDSCSFSGRGGETLEGVCIVVNDDDTLACGPKDGRRPPKK